MKTMKKVSFNIHSLGFRSQSESEEVASELVATETLSRQTDTNTVETREGRNPIKSLIYLFHWYILFPSLCCWLYAKQIFK